MDSNTDHTYEAMFLVGAAAAENWDSVMAAIDKLMQRSKAKIIKVNKWDERRLSYAVAGHRRGTYILCYFQAQPEAIRSMERDAQLDETILRALILRTDRMPPESIEAPTPYMQAQQQKQAPVKAEPAETPKADEIEEPGFDTFDVDVTEIEAEYPPAKTGADEKDILPNIMETSTEMEVEEDPKEKTDPEEPEKNEDSKD